MQKPTTKAWHALDCVLFLYKLWYQMCHFLWRLWSTFKHNWIVNIVSKMLIICTLIWYISWLEKKHQNGISKFKIWIWNQIINDDDSMCNAIFETILISIALHCGVVKLLCVTIKYDDWWFIWISKNTDLVRVEFHCS
mgnify:CR=1 FL=1